MEGEPIILHSVKCYLQYFITWTRKEGFYPQTLSLLSSIQKQFFLIFEYGMNHEPLVKTKCGRVFQWFIYLLTGMFAFQNNHVICSISVVDDATSVMHSRIFTLVSSNLSASFHRFSQLCLLFQDKYLKNPNSFPK